MPEMVPVLRPKLPEIPAILPYLQQIDANRWYGNFGPLVQAFEKRVQEMLDAERALVTMVANGTLGLTVALQALEVKRDTLCIMPSWTFTATPAAALAAGLIPAFIDVDAAHHMITPERVKEVIKKTKKPVGAVMPVSAFGAPTDVQAWDRFTEETGVPVVIDAAAAFDAFASGKMRVGRTPVMISMHATKICGIGEGGLLLTTSRDFYFSIRRIINFGFEHDRLSHRVAINGKPSEYNAAVGMAVLDQWPQIREAWRKVQGNYRETLSVQGIECCIHPDWITSVCNILALGKAAEMAENLRAKGIDTRRWWETGCHVHPAYRQYPVLQELKNTQRLGQSMLGLPTAMDLAPEAQAFICEQVILAYRRLCLGEDAAA